MAGCIYIVLFFLAGIIKISCSYSLDDYVNKYLSSLDPCANRPNGLYATVNAFKYLECKNGISKNHHCGHGETYIATCKKCLNQVKSQKGSFCYGRVGTSPAGKILKYQNPWDCNSWFECLHGLPVEYRCQNGLQFSPERQQCVIDAKKCISAYESVQHSDKILKNMPSNVDSTFLWPDGDILLVDGSTYFKYDKNDGSLLPGYPLTMMDHAASGIPSNIDAALSLPSKQTYFFRRNKVWLWGSDGYPKNIGDEWDGIPNNIDSAFYWSFNKKVYFFKGEYFYRCDAELKVIDSGYPKLISSGWPGAEETVEAAVGLRNGTVFLFKGSRGFIFHPPVCKNELTIIKILKDAMS